MGVVLAAGMSTRMGRPKPLLPLPGGESFIARIVRTLREGGADDVVVVLGHGADLVAAAIARDHVRARVAVNPRYEDGQLSSLLTGLDAAEGAGADAVLLTLVDIPLVSASTVRAVSDRYQVSRAPVVRPVCGDRHGHPVCLDRSLFSVLRAADPALGAKPVVRAAVSAAGDVAVEDEGAFTDIDTVEAYQRLVGGA